MPKKRKAAQPPTVASLVKQLCDESIEHAEQEAAAHALAQMAAEDDEKAKRVARALRSTEGSVEAVDLNGWLRLDHRRHLPLQTRGGARQLWPRRYRHLLRELGR